MYSEHDIYCVYNSVYYLIYLFESEHLHTRVETYMYAKVWHIHTSGSYRIVCYIICINCNRSKIMIPIDHGLWSIGLFRRDVSTKSGRFWSNIGWVMSIFGNVTYICFHNYTMYKYIYLGSFLWVFETLQNIAFLSRI